MTEMNAAEIIVSTMHSSSRKIALDQAKSLARLLPYVKNVELSERSCWEADAWGFFMQQLTESNTSKSLIKVFLDIPTFDVGFPTANYTSFVDAIRGNGNVAVINIYLENLQHVDSLVLTQALVSNEHLKKLRIKGRLYHPNDETSAAEKKLVSAVAKHNTTLQRLELPSWPEAEKRVRHYTNLNILDRGKLRSVHATKELLISTIVTPVEVAKSKDSVIFGLLMERPDLWCGKA